MSPRMFLAIATLATLHGCGTIYATQPNPEGEPVMLLGHDPVAYFTMGQPVRGQKSLKVSLPERTYYFANENHRAMFLADPAKYEPQYGGFCANGAPYGVRMGHDPREFEIFQGRLFMFGDIGGHSKWLLDPATNVKHADSLWPGMKDTGWRWATLKAFMFRVPWYQDTAQMNAAWAARNPGKQLVYDPGPLWLNLVKRPGWRSAEGYKVPALGYPE